MGILLGNSELPISQNLEKELDFMIVEYDTSLDWEYPPDAFPCAAKHKTVFLRRAAYLHERLKQELGPDFEVSYEVAVPA